MTAPDIHRMNPADLSTGYSTAPKPRRWQGFSHNWNLLLTVKKTVRLEYNLRSLEIPPHSLVMITPGGSRFFNAEAGWEGHWIHFDRNLPQNEVIEWNESIPGVYILTLEQDDYPIINFLFLQISQVATRRERYWQKLVLYLIQEIILRGNIIYGRGLASNDMTLAHKMLSNIQEELSMDEIAKKCNLSRSTFFAKFTETFQISPRKYREHCLMQSIQNLLENTDMTIKEITAQVHMVSPFYLSARFKLFFGLSPKEYRKKNRNFE